jgi:hypothetical protein
MDYKEDHYMIAYFKMKKNEWKVKAIIYGTIVSLIDNQQDILNVISKMYTALKDVPQDEIQKEFVIKLAEIIHQENKGR